MGTLIDNSIDKSLDTAQENLYAMDKVRMDVGGHGSSARRAGRLKAGGPGQAPGVER